MAEHFKKYWTRYVGAGIGLISGISALLLGFFKTLFLLLCALIGFVVVALTEKDQKVKSLLMKVCLLLAGVWQSIIGKKRY